MNKMYALLLVVLISVIYLAFDFFIPDETVKKQIDDNSTEQLTVIQPLKVEENMIQDDIVTENSNSDLDFRKPRESDPIAEEVSETQILNNLGKNYATLGEILDRGPALKEGVMEDLVEDIQRAKYNLEISKKMAAMTKDIYYLDENGERQMNQETLDKIHELRKKLIVKVNFDYTRTND